MTPVTERALPLNPEHELPQTIEEIVTDFISLLSQVKLPSRVEAAVRLRIGAQLTPGCVYDEEEGAVERKSVPAYHVYRSLRVMIGGWAGDGLIFKFPAFQIHGSAELAKSFVGERTTFARVVKSCMHKIFWKVAKGNTHESTLNAIFSGALYESEAKFAFFQSRNDKSLSPELLAKYHALYGFSFDDIRYYITFFGAVTTKTPSLNFEEFLPTASAFALSKKLYGAPLAAKNPMTLDLDSGVARFTSGSFTAIFIDRDDYIYLYTNVAAAVLHNGDVQISTDGCQMLITLEVPAVDHTPASDTALQPSASSSSSSSSAAFTELEERQADYPFACQSRHSMSNSAAESSQPSGVVGDAAQKNVANASNQFCLCEG